MLRMFALAVLLMALSTTAAHGSDRTAPAASDVPAPASSNLQSIDLRVPSALAWVRPSLRGVVSAGRARVRTGVAPSATRALPSARGGISDRPSPPGRESTALAYTLSDRLSLNVGYGFLGVEDVVVRRGEPGTVDPTYTSHHLVFHARWQF